MMRENNQETELKLSKIQLQSVINSHLHEDQGLNELFTMLVNGLMLSERSAFLDIDQQKANKAMATVMPPGQE